MKMIRFINIWFATIALLFSVSVYADVIFSKSAPLYVNLFYQKSSLTLTTSFNDDDRFMDAGQDAEIVAQVSNIGGGKAYDVTGYIDGEIPTNLVIQRKACIGHIVPGETKLISFKLTATKELSDDTIPLQLVMREKYGRFPTITNIDLSCRSENSTQSPEPTSIKTSRRCFSLENNKSPKGVTNPYAVAVLIGNRDYDPSTYGTCEYAINDIKAVKEYLIQPFGYNPDNIFAYRNARYEIFREMFGDDKKPGELLNIVKPDTSDIFIYYSGYGVHAVESNSLYIIPVDCGYGAENIAAKGYSVDLMLNRLAELSARSVTVVFDSSFKSAADSLKTVTKLTDIINIPDKSAIFFASSYNETANRFHETMHGLFTYVFLESINALIEQGKSSISAGLLFSQLIDVETGVPFYSRRIFNGEQQFPQFKSSSDFLLFEDKQ
ncbi:MAG: caspase family protein [Candidatus Latescibacteria bacterium]|nr:caspase family protein [Candidatus Latescibacterota bacterium]